VHGRCFQKFCPRAVANAVAFQRGKGIATLAAGRQPTAGRQVMIEPTRVDSPSATTEPDKPDASLAMHIRSHGDDAWRQDDIACTDWSMQLRGAPGTTESLARRALDLARL
jgi:hypothetical protein